MPIYWGSNKPGMQAGEELEPKLLDINRQLWLDARDKCIANAEAMIARGLHKQIANRILEPWAHINVVVTATEWANLLLCVVILMLNLRSRCSQMRCI